MPKDKSGESNRDRQRLQVPRRQINNLTSDVAVSDAIKCMGEGTNLPVWPEGLARVEGREATLKEEFKVSAEKCVESRMVALHSS